MTYKNLKKFLIENKNTKLNFDLIPKSIKSKIILCVGDGAHITSAILSSIMKECDVPHSHYTTYNGYELKNRFINSNSSINIMDLCAKADFLLQRSKKNISSEFLLFISALYLLDFEEYLILDITSELYRNIISHISAFAIVLATTNDEEAEYLISHAHNGTKEIISLTKKDNFDFISSTKLLSGARVSYASPNKINISKATIFETEFFHYDFKYSVPLIDQNNIQYAHLAIESANAIFSPIRQKILKGLKKSSPPDDFELHSLSPAILFRTNPKPFILHHSLDFDIVLEQNEVIAPSKNTIFWGNTEFIEKVKKQLN